jgi:2-hydroxychromene-2-carboxylate isomerase
VALGFWFEFASTYSYPAAMRVERIARARGVTLEWNAFLLGPIFQSQGWNDSPFNLYEAKGRYMWRDLERLAHKYGLPFRKPSVFPRSGLLAARVALIGVEESWVAPFARAVMTANFVDDLDIADPAVIGTILGALELPADDVLARAQREDNKAALKAQTDRAVELGLFGAPSFRADGELFWGNDRLDDAIAWARAGAPA